MTCLSFDGLSEPYDETRVIDEASFCRALDYLVNKFPPAVFPRVLEPGVGTGRIALPLAEKGYQVAGVDISDEMLAELRKRIEATGRTRPITFQTGNATELPFSNSSFDLTIVVHLFYFISNWRKAADEILRVVKDSGAVVFMHTGTGAEIPFLNGRYKDLCQNGGCPIKETGVKSTSEIVDYYASRGCNVEWVRQGWNWTGRIRLATALSYIEHRAYSFTTVAPAGLHFSVVKQLEQELKEKYGALNVEIEVPNEIYLVVVYR